MSAQEIYVSRLAWVEDPETKYQTTEIKKGEETYKVSVGRREFGPIDEEDHDPPVLMWETRVVWPKGTEMTSVDFSRFESLKRALGHSGFTARSGF